MTVLHADAVGLHSDAPTALFVGLDAYRAAGGTTAGRSRPDTGVTR